MVSYFAVVTYMIASSYQRSLMSATIATNPVTDLGFATVTICPLPKESQTQQLAICYGRVCKKSKEIL